MNLRRVPAKRWAFVPGELLGIFTFNSYFTTAIAVVLWQSSMMESIRLPRFLGRFMFQNEEYFLWLYKTKVWISTRQVTYADFLTKGGKVRYTSPRISDVMASLIQTPDYAANESLPQSQDDRYIPQWVKIVVVQRDGGRCVYCFENDPLLLEFDHRKSWVKGGSSKNPDNICLGCRPCNRKKGAKDWGWG